MALWTPADITTALWLDAADSSTLFDAVSGGSTPAANGETARWEDKSGNARHATQSTSGSRPVRKTALQNGIDALEFNGSSRFMSVDGVVSVFSGNDFPCSIFAACKSNNTTANQQIIWASNSTGAIFSNFRAGNFFRFVRAGTTAKAASSTTNTNWNAHAVSSSGTSATISLNGTVAETADVDVSTLAAIDRARIGSTAAGTDFFNGPIGELIVLATEASTDTRQTVEGYLAHKWGLTASLPSDHPYKTTPPGFVPTRRRRELLTFGRGSL
jgi:hypothetical protein